VKVHVKLALIILVVGMIATVAWRFIEPMLNDINQTSATDARAKKGTIHIGVDGWVGYFPLCSPEIRKRLYRSGYGIKCVDDLANYKERFDKLKNGDYEFAVATVDSYLLNGKSYDYPGPIVTVIDESKGGDAIISLKNKIGSLDDLKTKPYSVAFTPDSPSHHLLKAISSHFDIQSLRNPQYQVKTDGSQAALNALLKQQVDVAVVWEPEVTKALSSKGIVRLLGTEDTRQLIVDILIASQKTVRKNPDLVKLLLNAYYQTLKFYRENNDELIKDISDQYSVSDTQANTLLKGVEWVSLIDNVQDWYGITGTYSDEALIMSIESAVDILLENNDFNSNPIPDEDPYRLINSQFIDELNTAFMNNSGFAQQSNKTGTAHQSFKPLSAKAWDQLETIGSLKTHHIVFVSGTSDLTFEGKRQIDAQIVDLNHYPNFRIEIRGHTALRGDKNANLALSQERADAVLRYIEVTHGIAPNRARAIGFGSAKPLPKQPGESSRKYNYRLPRVEINLVRETI
jgi:outer membrane protein OmpA-like peptidoglycan-associated protein/ABC-type nitrate/sulfonate/bicarbonate transport system substrate-binding protein